MKSITLRKIWHREAFRIGIFFEKDTEIIAVLKNSKARFSSTHKCWYMDYTSANYHLLSTFSLFRLYKKRNNCPFKTGDRHR